MSRQSFRRFFLLTVLCAIPASLAAQSPPYKVVTTTGMIADAARRVGGTAVQVTALMGEGVDPHLYKASPGDVRLLTGASIIFFNGLHLEGKMQELFEALAKRKKVVAVSELIDRAALRKPLEFDGNYDPHIWFDVGLWMQTVERVASALTELAPDSAPAIKTNGDEYLAELKTLHEWCRAEIGKIPAKNRLLVTAHDAFGYFGRAYGLEVLGIQGISTDSEASLLEINRLVALLADRKIPAVFVESSVPRKTIESLVEGAAHRGHALAIGGELFSDAMGNPATPEGTYPGMVRHNVNTIRTALTREVP